ncbi:MAG: hypothetical protein RDU59_11765 [Thermodesulfobacteriota bacterium]|nr:hypothetical protein [Thermodesulfobacteriota bacterium]
MLEDTWNEKKGVDNMVVAHPGEEWVMKLGPISRTNQAKARKQAEEGALAQVEESVKEIMEKVRPAVPLLLKGAVCAGECEPRAKEDPPEMTVVSYQLSNGEWLSIASSGFFGVKASCGK